MELADLAITKTVDQPVAQPGDTVVYTITVTNNGPNATDDVGRRDPALIPANITGHSDRQRDVRRGEPHLDHPAPRDGGRPRPWTSPCSSGRAPRGHYRNLVAIQQSRVDDPDPDNNTADAELFVPAADIAVDQDGRRPDGRGRRDRRPSPSASRNLGPDAAEDVTVDDLLPEGLRYVSSTALGRQLRPGHRCLEHRRPRPGGPARDGPPGGAADRGPRRADRYAHQHRGLRPVRRASPTTRTRPTTPTPPPSTATRIPALDDREDRASRHRLRRRAAGDLPVPHHQHRRRPAQRRRGRGGPVHRCRQPADADLPAGSRESGSRRKRHLHQCLRRTPGRPVRPPAAQHRAGHRDRPPRRAHLVRPGQRGGHDQAARRAGDHDPHLRPARQARGGLPRPGPADRARARHVGPGDRSPLRTVHVACGGDLRAGQAGAHRPVARERRVEPHRVGADQRAGRLHLAGVHAGDRGQHGRHQPLRARLRDDDGRKAVATTSRWSTVGSPGSFRASVASGERRRWCGGRASAWTPP